MRHTIAALLVLCAFPALVGGQNLKQESLVTPFFEGWRTLGGNALYRIEDAGEPVIVGEATLNSPNTFLATEKEYGDFILDFEVQVDSPLNSGVQIRSHSLPTYNEGQVHGFQVEIDPSTRAWSGGIYEEGRRGWLYPLTQSAYARKAFRNGDWNQYHVEAIGNSVRTWVNGIQCANLLDADSEPGFIALQVHSIGNDSSLAGKMVRWRRIVVQTGDLETRRWPQQAQALTLNLIPNLLSDAEEQAGWQMLTLDLIGRVAVPGSNYGLRSIFNLVRRSRALYASPWPIRASRVVPGCGWKWICRMENPVDLSGCKSAAILSQALRYFAENRPGIASVCALMAPALKSGSMSSWWVPNFFSPSGGPSRMNVAYWWWKDWKFGM
ncbi:MAG: DUF1080 domain-containing protein [Lewinellaceae bacterium]|nr:DUF1080 domain-containing protein [Lewinellaceae bacterium]